MFEFWLPMVLLFAAATAAAIIARRRRDRCLKYFQRDRVLIHMQSGKWIWGRMGVYPKAIELTFETPEPDEAGLTKGSYVLYTPEVDGIRTILQPSPPAGTAAHDLWQREIHRVANPSLLRRMGRWIWNVFNTLRDAVSQSLSMTLGTLKTKTPMGKVAGADKRAGEVGQTLLNTVPNAYEPVLERYLSKPVVVEMLEEGTVVEFAGLLQEYSGQYLLLRNVAHTPTFDPEIGTGLQTPLPEHFDIIFPRNKALVRHVLA